MLTLENWFGLGEKEKEEKMDGGGLWKYLTQNYAPSSRY